MLATNSTKHKYDYKLSHTPSVILIHSMHFVSWVQLRLNFANHKRRNCWIEPHNLDIKNEEVTRKSCTMWQFTRPLSQTRKTAYIYLRQYLCYF